MELTTIIFDVDGTLLDNRFFCECLEALFRQRYPHRELEPGFFIKNNANTRQQNAVLVGLDFKEYEALVEETHRSIDPENFTKNDYPGVLQMLEKLRAQGYTLGLNTSRTRALLQRGQRQQPQLFSVFSSACTVTQSEVANPKPAPDPLLYLCERCGLVKDEVLYIGDAVQDAECANVAGVAFAWAAWGWHFTPESVDENDILLYHPTDIFEYITKLKKGVHDGAF